MTKRTDLNYWIYDFEVFKKCWMVTFKNFWTGEIKSIINNTQELINFYYNEMKNPILIGYNNAHYDNYILQVLLMNYPDPYELSQWIIHEKQNPWEFPFLKYTKKVDKPVIISFDMMKEVAPGLNNNISLKQLEAMLGYKIFESTIPFDLDRELTQEEIDETLKYNIYDVEITAEIFKTFGEGIDAHIALIEEYNQQLEPQDLIRTAIQKGAKILNANPILKYYKFNITREDLPEIITNNPLIDDELIDFYINEYESLKLSTKEKIITIANNGYPLKLKFALGGLHASLDNFFIKNKEIWNIDVASYYPNLMINYDLISSSVPDGVQVLKNILAQRLIYKKQKNILNESLKLMLNSIYGAMAYNSSPFWDRKKQTLICIIGQLLLYYLIKKLEPYSIIIQANTDGIMIIPINKEACDKEIIDWQQKTSFTLEKETGISIFQKDVNNYIFVKNTDDIKVKGASVRWWKQPIHLDTDKKKPNNPSNNYSIIDEALVKYYCFNIPLSTTIRKSTDPLKFIKVFKLQGKYSAVMMDDLQYIGKTFRFIAVKNGNKPYKCYIDDEGNWKKEKIANTSDNSIIILDDMRDKTIQELNLDIDYEFYENEANNILKLWEGDK